VADDKTLYYSLVRNDGTTENKPAIVLLPRPQIELHQPILFPSLEEISRLAIPSRMLPANVLQFRPRGRKEDERA
jgi:hypothetical protein